MEHSSPARFGPKRAAGARRHCDIFCTVIDNFGDAGVCLRLARQLATEHGWDVRLWIDRLDVLQRFVPELDPGATEQFAAGIRVVGWFADPAARSDDEIPEVVIEAFGCRLPPALVARMADRSCAPVWINLEYLSAEKWVDECHGLPSPDPATGLVKHFFFPGFASAGGLLRGETLSARVREFDDPERRRSFLASLGVQVAADALAVSMFCYPGRHIDSLIDAWRSHPARVHCLASSSLSPEVLESLRRVAADGGIGLSLLPFLSQDDYDRLLLSAAVNFVRGEDSFVRAQWAARPFVWQPYRQEEDAHAAKLDAFLDKYLESASVELVRAVRPLFRSWGAGEPLDVTTWGRFVEHGGAIREHNLRWSSRLQSHGDLAGNLAEFCESKL